MTLRIDPASISPEAYKAAHLAARKRDEEKMNALLEKKSRQAPRRYKLWEVISEEGEEYLRSIGATPESEPLEFAPRERHLSEKGYADLNSYTTTFWVKHRRLPRGVTNWTDPRPTFAQLPRPSTQQESLSELIAISADTVKSKAIEWLWNYRIPMSKLSVLAGNPDEGKSLISLYMMAQLTRGLPMFGDPSTLVPPSEVLLMAAEDDTDDTIVPRLQAMGADMKKIKILSTMMDKLPNQVPIEREAQLDRDIASLEAYLKANPNIRMIVIDPISSFLGKLNMNREQEVRMVLTPLKNLANRRHVAIVAIMHLNKVGDQSAIHRIGGAVAFTGVARAVWLFMRDEEDNNKRLMLRVKNNIAKATGGLVFNIATKDVMIEGKPIPQPVVSWVGETESSASDLLMNDTGRPNKETKGAEEWLRAFLADGPKTSEEIKESGKQAGFRWRTVERAKSESRVRAFQKERVWYWELITPMVSPPVAPGVTPPTP
jgi:putative DNA primase/helicase